MHKLRAVRGTRATGDPHAACYAICTCGSFATEVGPIAAVARAFDHHLLVNGVDPETARTPWRD